MSTTAYAPSGKQLRTRERRVELLTRDYANLPSLEHLKYRNKVVPGYGNCSNPSIMFVGASPTEEDVARGIPYSGRDGAVLGDMIRGLDLNRKNVYTTYLVKYWLKSTRDPRQTEIEASLPYLRNEIKIVQPKVVVLFGRVLNETFTPSVSLIHNHAQSAMAKSGRVYVPMWPPVAAMVNPTIREMMFKDFVGKVGVLL